jgi:hypothetical protein
LPVTKDSTLAKGLKTMAVKKTASSTKPKGKAKAAPKKKAAGAKGKSASAAKKEKAPKKKSAAAKKAARKKSPKKSPAKLTAVQSDLLGKVHGAGEAGYPGDKKAEVRTLEALRERKLVKRGPKNKEKGYFHYMISNAGKKHLESGKPAPAAPASSGPAPVAPPPTGGTM